MLETREKAKYAEEKSIEVMLMQERIVEKWKGEHKQTVETYEKAFKGLKTENRHLHEK